MASERLSSGQSALLHILRFLFAQTVLVVHLLFFFESRNPILDSFGNYVVVLFFVLSGFVICYRVYSLESLGEKAWVAYLKNRIQRIYPPLLGALALTWVLDYFSKSAIRWPYDHLEYARSFLMNSLQLEEFPLLDYLEKHYGIAPFHSPLFGSNLPLWTLAPEWWLYMAAGLIFLAFPHYKRKTWFWIAIVVTLISPLYYITHFTRVGIGLTIPWMSGFLAGYIHRKISKKQNIHSIWFWLLLGLSLVVFHWTGYFLASFLFGASLWFLANTDIHMRASVMRWSHRLSGYTYSLFLIHYPILYFIWAVFRPACNWKNIMMSFVSIHIIAYFFSRIFERLSIRTLYNP